MLELANASGRTTIGVRVRCGLTDCSTAVGIIKAFNTTSWDAAQKHLMGLECGDILPDKPIREAFEAWKEQQFWNGKSRRSVLNVAELSLRRVFDLSGVLKAHVHRFWHTLAIEILSKGGTIEDVARVLGNTPAVAYRHCAPWCSLYQNRIRAIMERLQEESKPDSAELHHGYTEKKRLPIV